MPLTDTQNVDSIKATPGGRVVLIINDNVPIENENERLVCFNSKLEHYAQYIGCLDFEQEYSKWPREKVVICLLSRTPATADMLAVKSIDVAGWDSTVKIVTMGFNSFS